MKVILLKDIDNLGRKNETKDVPAGFARNFLIPKGLVLPATEKNLKKLEEQKKQDEEKAAEELKEQEKLASTLDGREVIIKVAVGKEGQLFESINKKKISESLKEMGFNVEKEQINLENPIKETGEFPVKLELGHNLETEIKIIVSENND